MSAQLEANVSLINNKVQFKGNARNNPEIIADYFPPIGDGEGYTGLELLLMSLAVCSGTAVASLLRKMNKDLSGLNISANGIRRQQHPMSFEKINLKFILQSKDANEVDIQKAIKLSEESICPVWAMLKNNVEIVTEFKVIAL